MAFTSQNKTFEHSFDSRAAFHKVYQTSRSEVYFTTLLNLIPEIVPFTQLERGSPNLLFIPPSMKTHLCNFHHHVHYKHTKMKEKPTNIKHNGRLPTQKANIW